MSVQGFSQSIQLLPEFNSIHSTQGEMSMYPLISLWHTLTKRLMLLLLISVMSLAGILTLAIQPSYAQVPLNSNEAGHAPKEFKTTSEGAPLDSQDRLGDSKLYNYSKETALQEETKQLNYDELAEQAKNPRVLKTQYQDDLKSYQETHPGESLIDKAKDLFEK